MFMASDIKRSSFATSEKGGLESGSVDQHFCISDLHEGSHQLGISGLKSPWIKSAEHTRAMRKRTSRSD